jgi:natural product biosynthesis luciferase-like monooxygenase protein
VISGRQADFADRKAIFADKIDRLRRLWRGEPFETTNPLGEQIRIQTIPRPMQRELPLWITAAANPETFRQAGELGANLLTHLLGQTVDGLAEKIGIYRDAWRQAGHAGEGLLTVMLHTLVGPSDDTVRELAREPMKRYLAGSLNLAAGHLASVPFLQRGADIDVSALTPELADQVLDASFEKYFHMSSLMGSYEKCLDAVDRLEAIGVDEIACLIDFGVAEATVLESLDHLQVVRLLANQTAGMAVTA